MSHPARKRFVSLFFTLSKIQVVYLSSDKKSVEKFATYDIPTGIISNRKVVDSQKLSEIIKNIWQKLHLREKYVGIVVPEFSTYIKAIKLPKVEKEDLSEAVYWQASDVMPTSQTDTVLDWKIIEEDEKEYTILVASIKKDVLAGYIDAISKAGLSPLVLETPSLSLSRVTNHEDFGKLVIYQAFDEVIILVAKKENIFGSSISSLGDENIISTSQRIGTYYSNVKIERVVVGGINISQNLLNLIVEKLKIRPEWVKVELSGMNAQQLQEYMIPISHSLKEPYEPRDETTINLLPMDWAKSYEVKRFKSKVRRLLIDSFLIVLMLVLVSGGFYMSLNIRLNNITQNVKASDSQEAQKLAEESKKINTLSDKVIKINENKRSISDVISSISQAKVAGVEIRKLGVSFEKNNVEIIGFSTDRAGLIEFKKNLDKTELFENVNIPLSVLEKEKDIEFDIILSLKSTEKANTGVIQIPSDFVKQ